MFNKKIFDEISNTLVGSSSLIIKDGEIKEQYNFGYLDLETKSCFTEKTVLRIASISKLVVATVIMKLYEEGLVNLKEDVSKYLGFKLRNPKFKDTPITLEMIMTQSSSISDGYDVDCGHKEDTCYNRFNRIDQDVDLSQILIEEGKYYSKETFINHKPGTKFHYSNFGCGILACIAERVTGEYFFDLSKKYIFDKLDLDASFMASDIKNKDIASSYRSDKTIYRSGKQFLENSIIKHTLGNNYVGPAGGVFINILDLSKLMQVYMSDGIYQNTRILEKDTMDRMLQISFICDKTDGYTAKGLQFKVFDEIDGVRYYGHFGTAYGIKTTLLFSKHQNLGMIFFTNGGEFQPVSGFGSDVQEKFIRKVTDKYWDRQKPHEFKFNQKEKFGFVDGRKIELNLYKPLTTYQTYKTFLDIKTIVDGFSISTIQGKKYLEEEFGGMNVGEVNMYLNNNFITDYVFDEDHNNIIKYYELKEKIKVLKENYHTHSDYCDHAKGKVIDYFRQAYKLGMKTLGMSGHGPMPLTFYDGGEGYRKGHMTLSEVDQYVKDCKEARKELKGKLDVQIGLEIEYIEGHDEYYKMLKDKVDYLVLGQHFMYHGKYVDTYYNLNYKNLWEYTDSVCIALKTGLFKILAHPDLFLYDYRSKNGNINEFDEECVKATIKICQTAQECNIPLEINAVGIGRGKGKYKYGNTQALYTTKKFFEIAKEYDVKFIIGLDAHNPKGLYCNALELCYRFAKELGIKVIN